jgi:hypothetical protein
MCQLSRVNTVFVDRIDCEEGKRLRQEEINARIAYTSYIGNEQTSQALYDTYDKAKTAYDRHLEETSQQ